MIVVYPMIVSNNVSPNILPGITKTVEKYIITYKMSDLMDTIKKEAGIKGKFYISNNSKLKIEESDSSFNSKTDMPKMNPGNKPGVGSNEKPGEKGNVKVEMPTFGTLSLEPTWIKVDTYYGARLIAVKVIPFPIQSDVQLIDAINQDTKRNFIDKALTSMSRNVTRKIAAIFRRFTKLSVTGDYKKDILWASTIHGENIFLALNLMDFGSQIMDKTKTIKQLHNLGWSSLVFCDDVNKKCFFCMKEFNGLCSGINYSFLYTSIGKEHGKVYEDLEDVKKSASPFFKLSKPQLGEQFANYKLGKYLIDLE